MTSDVGKGGAPGRWAARALVLVVSLLLSFAGAELAVRLLVPQLAARPLEDVALGWSSPEYQRFDPTVPRRGDELRWLFVGDSFLAGSGVSALEGRFPLLIERLAGGAVDVAILATGGWGTGQQLLALSQKGTAWSPDLVVLAFSAVNDLVDIAPTPNRPKAPKPYFGLSADSLVLVDSSGQRVERLPTADAPAGSEKVRSMLLELIRYRWRAAGGSGGPDDAGLTVVDGRRGTVAAHRRRERRRTELYAGGPTLAWSPQASPGIATAFVHEDLETNTRLWRLLEAILARFRSEVEAAGGRLVLVLLPTAFGPRPELIVGGPFTKRFDTPNGPFTLRIDEPRRRLAAIARRQGVAFLDPTPAFIAHVDATGQPYDYYFGANHHFGDEAHRWLAEWLYPELRRR